jgi:hypothetical protein
MLIPLLLFISYHAIKGGMHNYYCNMDEHNNHVFSLGLFGEGPHVNL